MQKPKEYLILFVIFSSMAAILFAVDYAKQYVNYKCFKDDVLVYHDTVYPVTLENGYYKEPNGRELIFEADKCIVD